MNVFDWFARMSGTQMKDGDVMSQFSLPPHLQAGANSQIMTNYAPRSILRENLCSKCKKETPNDN